MEITIGEAADALDVSLSTVHSWYIGETNADTIPPYTGINSEVLCDVLGMDHRFMMAFLTGYDVALSRRQMEFIFRQNEGWVYRHVKTEPVFRSPSARIVGRYGTVRYSYRRVAPLLLAELEKAHGNHRASAFGGGVLLPPPDAMPSDSWTFCSALTTEGTRLPRARRTVLVDGRASTLEIPERGPEWKRRKSYARVRDDGDGHN